MNELLAQVVERTNTVTRQAHVFYEGQAWDFDFDNLDIGMMSTDAEVRNKVAEALDVPSLKVANFTVERNAETEDITLRPQAVFGS